HERLLHVANRIRHTRPGIAHHVERHAGRQRLSYFLDALVDLVAHARRASALGLGDVDAYAFHAVEECERSLLRGSVIDIRDVREADHLTAPLRDDELTEISCVRDAPTQSYRALLQRARDHADRNREIL